MHNSMCRNIESSFFWNLDCLGRSHWVAFCVDRFCTGIGLVVRGSIIEPKQELHRKVHTMTCMSLSGLQIAGSNRHNRGIDFERPDVTLHALISSFEGDYVR